MTAVTRAIVVENKWRAQRYGVNGTFASADGSGAVTVAEQLEQVLSDVLPDAEELGCATHVGRCRAIVGAGTSADAQIAVYQAHEKSESRERALEAVNDWLAAATLQ
jgi:carboxylate-amine ligase